MDNDDDVEHLFSWLQTADLRYREFAGAREITDSVIVAQQRRADNTAVPQDAPQSPPRHDNQVAEEYPVDQFPDHGESRVEELPTPHLDPREEAPVARAEERRGRPVAREGATAASQAPGMIAPVPMATEAPTRQDSGGPFALSATGRNLLRVGPAEWVGPRPPLIQTPAPSPAASPTAPPSRPAAALPAQPTTQPTTRSAPSGGLLGGAYREGGANGHGSSPAASGDASSPPDGTHRNPRSLDAVFGRLAGGRGRVPDPRDRMRHIPGFNPPAGRPR